MYEDRAMRRLVALGTLATVLGLASPAHADSSGTDAGLDANFLTALDQAGITYQTAAGAIAVARNACGLMAQGRLQNDVINDVAQENPGFAPSGATRFTAIAVNIYCPQQPPPPEKQPSPPPSASFFDLPPLPAAAP